MNNGSFAKYTTAYINRPSNSQLVDIKIEIEMTIILVLIFNEKYSLTCLWNLTQIECL